MGKLRVFTTPASCLLCSTRISLLSSETSSHQSHWSKWPASHPRPGWTWTGPSVPLDSPGNASEKIKEVFQSFALWITAKWTARTCKITIIIPNYQPLVIHYKACSEMLLKWFKSSLLQELRKTIWSHKAKYLHTHPGSGRNSSSVKTRETSS